jgi:glycosyltransferase involved in cell wall biosynthesis
MRIRFFAYFYAPCVGGGEVILQHQAMELARRGHEVHVHCTPYTNLDLSSTAPAGDRLEDGVHVHRRASRRIPFRNPLEKDAFTPAFFADAWRGAELLVCVGYPSFHLDWLLARRAATGTRLVVQNYVTADFLAEILAGQGGANKRLRAAYWRRWMRPALARADLVLADSPAAARALEAFVGAGNVRLHIGMAVDPGEFATITDADRRAVRARLGLGDARVILAPSRVSRQKGADLLVEAAAPLLGEGVRLVIAGPVNEPSFADGVRARAAGLAVVMTELPRRELLALMTTSAVVALPSRGETVGGVVMEGMYAGATCVVSDAVEAAREDYLRDGVNGLLVPCGDVGALRRALVRALAEDAPSMRREARRMVEDRFTWGASVDRLEALLRG